MEVLMAERANLAFHNNVIDGTAIKTIISRLIDHFGMGYTSHILDQVKTVGFQQATATSLSLGIDDLLTLPSKGWLVQDIEQQNLILENHYRSGNVHAIEKLRQSIEVWYAESEYLKSEMHPNFSMTDPFNSVHIMSFSGARGNTSQVHQLVGMRGLMSDPQGQMIDLPIPSNFREGLSLTEYIISCYGARKGVVDTAIRTATAGYLTRRLVEVVQHIVVRRTDCGTTRGISVSPQNEMSPESIFIQTLIGRVLADNFYMGSRCIAIRNQDIGIELVDEFINFRSQPISIRTPFTCKSTSWICRLCYGRSPTHGDLVELGEAVGIIAGQSIGEPGTQLTLRTFHTGGVFTGGITNHVRAPFNGKIQFNEDLIHPTRTRHGHPAFLCYRDFYVTIESQYTRQNVSIPAKSLLFVQNDQYVKSQQVIAEICEEAYTLNLKEKVRKHIYSDSEGEMHWSTDVYHAPKFTHSNVHLLPKTSHLWILASSSCKSSRRTFSLHKDQDQMSDHSLYGERKSISSPSANNDQVQYQFISSNRLEKNESRIPDYLKLNPILGTAYCNRTDPAILQENADLLAKRRKNRFIIPFQSIQERDKELMSNFGLSIEMPLNGLLGRNSIFAYLNDPQYRSKSSGIINYGGAIDRDSIGKEDDDLIEDGEFEIGKEDDYLIEDGEFEIGKEDDYLIEDGEFEIGKEDDDLIEDGEFEIGKEDDDLIEDGEFEIGKEDDDLIEDGEVNEFKSKCKMEVNRFFFIPEEVYLLPESSCLMVRNNSIIGIDTQITLNIRSRVGGLVQVQKKKKKWKLKIFSGDIHFPGEADKISKHSGMGVIPRRVKSNSKESTKVKTWIYVQWITPRKKKSFVFVRPIILYERADGINLATLFYQDLLQEKDNLNLRVVNSLLYANSNLIQVISKTSIQLVRTSLLLNWEQDKNNYWGEEACASVVEVSTNGLIQNFLRINLVKSTISYMSRKRNDSSSSEWISARGSVQTITNPFFSIYSKEKIQQSLQPKQNQGTSITLLNRNKECQSLRILSSVNCFRIDPFQNAKDYNGIKKSIKKDSLIPIRNSLLGPLGTTLPISTSFSFYHLITHNKVSVTPFLKLENLNKAFQVIQYYLIDENRGIGTTDPCASRVLNPFHLNWYFLHPKYNHHFCEFFFTIISLGEFICENVAIAKKGPELKSGQVIIIHLDSVVLRSAQPYLATPGATVHGHYGEILYEGDTLITFLYEKARSGDITQGLPKVEQVVEVRSIKKISPNLKERVKGWNEWITRILGIPWGFLIGAELTLMQSRISLVNEIQQVYRSQEVQIHNLHIEIIVRQITSKVLVSEDGMSKVFLPGELIGLSRAERTGRALEEAIYYRAKLLGITRTSLNTQSFISEASFQETARVLAKSALCGRIDWLKGLKENVVLASMSMSPLGTAFKRLVHGAWQYKSIPLKTKRKNLFEFEGEMRDLLFHHKELVDSSISKNGYDQKNTAEQNNHGIDRIS